MVGWMNMKLDQIVNAMAVHLVDFDEFVRFVGKCFADHCWVLMKSQIVIEKLQFVVALSLDARNCAGSMIDH